MKRILLIALALLLCISVVSCSEKKDSDKDEVTLPKGCVLGYGDTYVTESYFMSEVSMYKSSYLYSVMGVDADLDGLWDEESNEEGVTKGDAILNLALEECFAMAWAVDWGKKNGIDLTDEDRALIDEDIATVSEQYGGYDKFIEAIKESGLTEEEFYANSEFSLLYEKSISALTAEGGIYGISAEEIDKYFNDNFVAVKHVYVNNVAEVGEDGTYVQITSDNYDEKMKKADNMESALKDGEDFDVLYAMSEDGMKAAYPDGMVITAGDVASVDYEEACFALKEGEWKRVDIPMYGIYFIKRVEMPQDLVDQRKAEVPYYMRADVQHKIWEDHKDEFVVNFDFVDKIDVSAVPVG